MATAVIMPKSGQSVESCIITSWNKKEGDTVKNGDLLFSYETDKASFEEYAAVDGTMLKILHEEGDDVPCLENVCVIGAPGEDAGAFAASGESDKPVAQAAQPAETKAEVQALSPAKREEGERLFVSPRARHTAERRGVDPADATPTGPYGRVIERDVMALEPGQADKADKDFGAMMAAAGEIAHAAAQTAVEYIDEPLPHVRKVIAKSMHASLSEMAQLTNHFSFDATSILAYRKTLKANAEDMGLNNITLNDIVLFAVSRVLKNHKALNAHYLGDKMRYFTNVNLGIAVDTPRGLLVPTLFNADKLSLNEISAQAKQLALAAQSGSIAPDLLTGASFTVSNLGTLGVEMFTPVINPPQTGILGVCTSVNRVKVVNGEMKAYPAMGLSLTYDHRAVDGAPASRFAQELCRALENFSLLLAK